MNAAHSARVLAAVALIALACNSSTSPREYTGIQIEPREFLVALGVTRPLVIEVRGISSSGALTPLSRARFVISIADTSYAALRSDSVAGLQFGQTYLKAAVRDSTGHVLRDSIPIIVFKLLG